MALRAMEKSFEAQGEQLFTAQIALDQANKRHRHELEDGRRDAAVSCDTVKAAAEAEVEKLKEQLRLQTERHELAMAHVNESAKNNLASERARVAAEAKRLADQAAAELERTSKERTDATRSVQMLQEKLSKSESRIQMAETEVTCRAAQQAVGAAGARLDVLTAVMTTSNGFLIVFVLGLAAVMGVVLLAARKQARNMALAEAARSEAQAIAAAVAAAVEKAKGEAEKRHKVDCEQLKREQAAALAAASELASQSRAEAEIEAQMEAQAEAEAQAAMAVAEARAAAVAAADAAVEVVTARADALANSFKRELQMLESELSSVLAAQTTKEKEWLVQMEASKASAAAQAVEAARAAVEAEAEVVTSAQIVAAVAAAKAEYEEAKAIALATASEAAVVERRLQWQPLASKSRRRLAMQSGRLLSVRKSGSRSKLRSGWQSGWRRLFREGRAARRGRRLYLCLTRRAGGWARPCRGMKVSGRSSRW